MSKNINLALKEETEGIKLKNRLKVFRLVAAGSLLALLLTSLLIYLLNSRLGFSSIQKEKDALLSQLLPFREKETKLKVINDRLNNISLGMSQRNDVYRIVNKLLGEVPSGMSVDNLELTHELITIKVSSNSLILVDELINNLTDMAQRKEIISVLILNFLDATDNGIYSVSMNISLI